MLKEPSHSLLPSLFGGTAIVGEEASHLSFFFQLLTWFNLSVTIAPFLFLLTDSVVY